MKTLNLILLSILAVSFVSAADKPAAAEKPVINKAGATDKVSGPAEKNEGPEQATIELKNKSVFVTQNGSRDPFWPIGFKPAGKISNAGSEGATGDIAASAFVVSTITMDPRGRFAIINGKPMVEGQQFGLQMGTQTYQISVKRIEDGRVVLGRRDQEIVVPLRRK